jgi:hypothetical protein
MVGREIYGLTVALGAILETVVFGFPFRGGVVAAGGEGAALELAVDAGLSRPCSRAACDRRLPCATMPELPRFLAQGAWQAGVGHGARRSRRARMAQPALQGAPAAPPAKKDDERKEEKKGFDINIGELALDKIIDFVLIFVGLYAALAVQQWQDTAKEKTEYVKLLGDFKAELDTNRKQREAIEKDIGPVADKEPGKTLGPLQKHFDDFKKEADEAQKLLGCLDDTITISTRGARSPKDRERLAVCMPVLEAAEKHEESTTDTFKPITLSPLYRSEVWQLYLANGIKVFENKELAVKIGSTYSSAKQVEKNVAEIEALFNDSFIQRIGEVMASIADLEESMPEGDDPKEIMAMQPKIGSMGKEMRSHKFATTKVENMLDLKVRRLKELLAQMDREFAAVSEEIDKELGKQKK